MNYYIDASNIHSGGGKTMLNDFIAGAKNFPNIQFIFWIDHRFDISNLHTDFNNINFIKVSKLLRFLTCFKISRLYNPNDLIIFFGNVPPLINYSARTILLQSNRFLVENISTSNMKLITRIQINFQRFFFKCFKNNVDEIIVQSTSMQSIIKNQGNLKAAATVVPFKDFNEDLINQKKSTTNKKNSFIYIASEEPHKNHKNLISAWTMLAKENIFPKLSITVEKNSNLFQDIVKSSNTYNLDIEILSNITRKDLMFKFANSGALIYPSRFESYGLPLVEAKILGIDIIASELDYVRDMVDPIETFDPESPISIARSVKRYLKQTDKKTYIMSSTEFINYLNT